MRELLQVEHVLLELRLVEAELPLQRLPRLGGRVRDAREVRDRASGRKAEEREVDRDGNEDRQHGERQPLDDVVRAFHG